MKNKEITLGDKFDAMEGVSVTDKEDGDLTEKVVVTGEVDVLTAGSYELVYTVEDSAGHKVVAKAVITVVEEETPVDPVDPTEPVDPVDPVDPSEPTEPVDPVDPTEPTEPVDPVDPSEPVDPVDPVDPSEPEAPATETWDASKVYNSGDTVIYNGKYYQAQWWTQGETPGSSAWGAWKEIGDAADSTDSTEPAEPEMPAENTWSASAIYNSGDTVIYDGKTYRAQWWTQGEVPGSSAWGAWKVVG